MDGEYDLLNMNPHTFKKLARAMKNRYFRRIRCLPHHRSGRDRRRMFYWERVLRKWEARAAREYKQSEA